jgi:hypothetical protein
VLFIFLVFCVVVFGGVCVVHRFSFLCCVFCFACLRPVSCVPNVVSVSGLSSSVSCVPNVASVSGLSILDCPIRFSLPFCKLKFGSNLKWNIVRRQL